MRLLSLILILLISSCNSNKKTNEIQIDSILKDTFNLEVRLPFESSNNWNGNDTNFKLINAQGKILEPQFDTVTKTGGYIDYSLKNGKYTYYIKTPFNEVVKRDINIDRDTAYYFYESCYEKVQEFSLNDLTNSKKINISVNYEFDEEPKDEIEIERKKRQYSISFKENNHWTRKISIDSSQIINAVKDFENDILRMDKKKIIGTEEMSYLTASQVFIKYEQKLYEVHNIKHDSLIKATDKLKRRIEKIL
ncbi:hypothetical protein [Cellulophaga sp. HaHa_2_1]|uniref:hypothetical protein n=1 Tax=Cellulophaga sp. HaHa_2_1 TaxID=2749994 RepID=UPI001C4E6535|nr:hypothetical protein [Cellulophaga sp. HaHa_2_1]QXP52518.1 hypothetical protein H0I24_00915 [Cellulophaga sp. HaHa_2_1]